MVAKIDPGTAAGQQNGIPTPLNCPRCDSANTKFCYYNNYSLSQPRHFCKSCKRYWTRGGTLRNVPVGGGSRKNKRAKKHHRSAAMSAAAADPSLPPPPIIHVTSTDFNSLFYSLPAINSATVSLPKFDLDAQLAGYGGKYFQPCLGANLLDLQKLTASPKFFLGDYSISTSQIPSSSSAAASAGAADGYQPLISFDEFPMETHEINTSHKSIECQFIRNDNPAEPITSFAASVPGAEIADSSYLYWNQAVSGAWPESGSSSMAPLF